MAQRRALVHLLKSKLSNITLQKDELQGIVDTFVSNMTATAMTAIESDEQDMQKLKELNSLLDTVPVFLIGLIGDIEDHMSGSADKTPDSHQVKPVPSSSLSEPSPEKSVQEVSYSDITKLCQRMDMLEIAMKGCCSDVRQCSTQHSETMQELKERCHALNETLETFTKETNEAGRSQLSRLDRLENDIGELEVNNKQLMEKLSEDEKQYNIGLASTEENLKKIVSKQSDVMTEVAAKVDKVEKRLKKLEAGKERNASRLDSLVDDVETLKSQSSEQQQESSKLKNLDQQVKNLKSQFGSLQNLEEDVHQAKLTVDELTSRLECANKDELCDVLETTKSISRSLEEMSSRIDATETSMKSSVSFREKELNKRKEMEDRLSVVEANRNKDVHHYAKELDVVQSLFKQVCCLVDSKVEPLRRLHRILNDYHKRVESRETLAQRIDKVTDQMNALSTQVCSLNTNHQQPVVAFTARCSSVSNTLNGSSFITEDFNNVLFNESYSYNPTTGVFTAPHDGVYFTSVTMVQQGPGQIRVHVGHRRCGKKYGNGVCKASTTADQFSSCGVGVVRMNAGDTLYIYVLEASGGGRLSDSSIFSCISVG